MSKFKSYTDHDSGAKTVIREGSNYDDIVKRTKKSYEEYNQENPPRTNLDKRVREKVKKTEDSRAASRASEQAKWRARRNAVTPGEWKQKNNLEK